MIVYDLLKDLIPVRSCLKMRDNGDLLIVMNENGELHYLNQAAKFIYTSFGGKRTIADILNQLKEEYEAESDEDVRILKHDVVEIIRDLQWQKNIKLREA